LGTKEIGVTLPAAVFLLEAFFFAPNKKKFWAATLAVVAAVSIVVVVFFNDDFKAAVHILQSGSYANRGFTMAERLLTEPRVFLHYISLTVFPFYTRYILDYDYPPSRSLVVPPSTLFGIAFIVLTLGLAVWLMKRNKILSLSIILFWLGHVVEGSFLNLELVFEHRMYMPSAFLILIAVLLVAGLEGRWGLSSKVLAAAGAAIFVYLGLNTVLRNGVWRDPIRFYELNIEKAPQFFRPYHNLGVYLGGIHQDEKALSYFFKAAELNPKNFQTYEALGETYFTLKNDELAIKYFEKAESLDRLYSIAYSDMAISYMRLGRGEDALRTVAESLKIHAKDPELLATAGTIILYCLQKRSVPTAELDKYGFDEARALQMLEASFEAGYRSKDLYLNLTAAYARKSERETDEGARRLLQKKVEELAAEARRIFPEDSATKKNLISSYLLQGRWKELLAMPEMSKKDLFQVALPLMNSSRIAEALDVLKAMEARFGRDPFIEFNQAICRYMLGSQPLAVEVFKRYAGDPSYPELKAQAENYLKDWEKRRVRK
jgi:tetratricopeptide (TPR) repeat protein